MSNENSPTIEQRTKSWESTIIGMDQVPITIPDSSRPIISCGCGVQPTAEMLLAQNNPTMTVIGIDQAAFRINDSRYGGLIQKSEGIGIDIAPNNLKLVNGDASEVHIAQDLNPAFLFLFPDPPGVPNPMRMAPSRLAGVRSAVSSEHPDPTKHLEYIKKIITRYPNAYILIATEMAGEFAPQLGALNEIVGQAQQECLEHGTSLVIGGDIYPIQDYRKKFPATETINFLTREIGEENISVVTYEINPNLRPDWALSQQQSNL